MLNIEEELKKSSAGQKALLIIGSLFFVAMPAFLLLHMGFSDPSIHHGDTTIHFLSRPNLWYLHFGMGLVGGILLDIKNPVIGAVSGLFAAAAVTGLGLFYLGWRESILSVEVILPLFAGFLVGVVSNRLLKRILKGE